MARSPPLELAYALTVHKSQGSEFGITFVVLPDPCWPLSRELLYTALTRQQDRVVVLHQGDLRNLRRYASDKHSDIARRLTNLFAPPSPTRFEVDGTERFLEEGLIHRTKRGDLVRSKSEVIIANELLVQGIDRYEYETALSLPDGRTRYPDFSSFRNPSRQRVLPSLESPPPSRKIRALTSVRRPGRRGSTTRPGGISRASERGLSGPGASWWSGRRAFRRQPRIPAVRTVRPPVCRSGS